MKEPRSYLKSVENMKSSPVILLVEDDADLGSMLKLYLETEPFEIILTDSAEEGWNAYNRFHCDMAILDVNLPGENGFSLASRIRKQDPAFPFLFLTARTLKEERIKGLTMGADDYITKPFDAEELVIRVQNILRRYAKAVEKITRVGEFELDFTGLRLIHPHQIQMLTRREAELLRYLMQKQNKLVPTAEILKELWGENDYFLGKSMNVFISRLRKYLSRDPSISIRNIRGEGYELSVGH